jgi:hypothetical protein
VEVTSSREDMFTQIQCQMMENDVIRVKAVVHASMKHASYKCFFELQKGVFWFVKHVCVRVGMCSEVVCLYLKGLKWVLVFRLLIFC